MKKIEALIKPFKLEEVREALIEVGIEGMTVTEVEAYGQRQADSNLYRYAEYVVDFIPMVKIEVLVGNDEYLQKALESIEKAAGIGKIEDEKI